jgi:hypothetical protein
MYKKWLSRVPIANFTFHGADGDYLLVSKHARQELLDYLVNNADTYWLDPYRNVNLYVKKC